MYHISCDASLPSRKADGQVSRQDSPIFGSELDMLQYPNRHQTLNFCHGRKRRYDLGSPSRDFT